METPEAAIREHDVIALTRNLPDHGLRAGETGTVVHDYGDGETFEVEFVAEDGDTKALLTLARADISPAINSL